MNKSNRILVITSTYPRHEKDYAVPWMHEQHKRLQQRGHRITVLAPSYQGLQSHSIDGIAVRRFRYAPASIERLTHKDGATYNVRRRWMQLLAVPYVILGCLAAARLVRRKRFDVIHVHWPFPHGLIGQVARWFSGLPMVVMSHGAEFSLARRKRWITPFLRQSLQAADLLVANSSDTARMVSELSGRECKTLPYGATVRRAATGASENRLPRVLFTGRLIERKGLEYLLAAIPNIMRRHPAEFVITGDGDQRNKLEKLHEELKLGDSVKFLGFVSNDELAQQYAACDIWVNPAIIDSWGDAEGLGVGAIEAYSYGKPVVAGNVGGIPDAVVDGVTGILVPQRDCDALADAIVELLSDPVRRSEMGNAGFEFARRKFGWSRIISELEEIYFAAQLQCGPPTVAQRLTAA